MSTASRQSLPYVPCSTVDQQFSQRTVGPTPFSSAKSRNADYEQPSLILATGIQDADAGVAGCRMSYPASLRSHRPQSAIHVSRSMENIFRRADQGLETQLQSTDDAAVGEQLDDFRLPLPSSQLQIPTDVWTSPPPVFRNLKASLKPEPALPRDTLHPLISALQAGENLKSRLANPSSGYLANASRKGPPCEAHRQTSSSTTDGSRGSGAAADDADGLGEDEEDEDGTVSVLSPSGKGRGPHAKNNAFRGDLRTYAGRNFSALGGFHEPERYATTVAEFASAQPTTLTAMAAKALGSALHDRPSHAIPANVAASVQSKPLPNSGPKGGNVNRNTFSGLNNTSNMVVSPPEAFRNLSSEFKEVLLGRERDCRHRLAKVLREKYPVMQPPPVKLEGNTTALTATVPSQVVDRRKKEEHNRKKSDLEIATANMASDADPEAMDLVSDSDLDPIAALGETSTLGIWLSAVRQLSTRRLIPPDLIPTPAHPARATVLSQRLKVLTPQLISMHTSMSLAPQPHVYLSGTGIAMGDAQAQMKPPSLSSFLNSGPVVVTQYSDLELTPPNAFAFDSERFVTLLSDKGEEVEELFLEGCTWLSDSALAAVGRYCVNLRLINLQDCSQLSDNSLTAIAETSRNLAYVNLNGCVRISGQPLVHLFRNCKDLHTLCMSGLPLLDEDSDIAFAQMHRVPKLVNLDVSYCENLTNAIAVAVAQYCRGLQMIDISGCKKLTDSAVASIGMSCTQLRQLSLRLCTQFTDAGLRRLAVAPSNLKMLDVGGVTQLTPPVLEAVLMGIPRLRRLSISGCMLLDDVAVGCITRYCKHLKHLDLSSCHGVSMASCMELVHELVHLRWLIVSESSISNAEVVMLSALRESCKIIRNQYRPQQKPTLIAYRYEEKKKPAAADSKGGAKKKK